MKIEDIDISHPEKPIFPDREITKLDLVNYYEKIADKMLPYLKDRPLTLQRFPDGIDTKGFYQKNAADYFPDYIERISIETKQGKNTQVICNDKKTLIYLANQGVVTFHIWLSKKDELHKPDKVVFDLDPPKNAFEKTKDAEIWIANMITDKADGTLVDTSNITVNEYFEKFLTIYKKPYISTTTYDNYYRRFKKHIKPV